MSILITVKFIISSDLFDDQVFLEEKNRFDQQHILAFNQIIMLAF